MLLNEIIFLNLAFNVTFILKMVHVEITYIIQQLAKHPKRYSIEMRRYLYPHVAVKF